MSETHWDRNRIHSDTATPVAEFPFVDAARTSRPVLTTLTKANVTVIEIGTPWSLNVTCYGLRFALKISVHTVKPNLGQGHADSICRKRIVRLSHDLAVACGARSKMVPTIAIKDAVNNNGEQIYSVLFALPLLPSLEELGLISECLLPAKRIMGPANFYEELRLLYARADFLEERAEAAH